MLSLMLRSGLATLCLLMASVACAPAIQNIVLTTQVDSAGSPLNAATDFSVDTPRILCSVNTAGLPGPATVQAKWLFNDGISWKTLKEESFPAAGASYIVFAVNAPDSGWQQGNYAFRLLLDGKQVTEKQFSIRADENVSLPVINTFSATPGTVTAGQPLTLSWNVGGATRVAISPDIGSVDAGGSRTVTPQADTTYTITALSSGGPSSKSVSVQVLPPVTETADLEVIDIFREASMVYYRVRNNGTAISKPSSTNLYVGMNVMGSGYIPPMAPGEQKTLVFGTFSWSYAYTTPATVCIDTQNENGPSNGQYKCLTRALAGVRLM
ncbi:MAG: hypothetical protein NTV42_09180 [Chloroflexi bacterium]|nr:hypothetical protein [Chloroflexota bacterium]